MRKNIWLLGGLFLLVCMPAVARQNILNIYVWSGEIPEVAIAAFQKETGIKVNYATFDSNEVLYAKLKATGNPGYDVIMPSSYYVDRMRKEKMLMELDKTRLPLMKNLDPYFLNLDYDPDNNFSIPVLWGTTGIFVNDEYYPGHTITQWSDLWQKKFTNKLLLLDDIREIFSMGLMTLGYSANDQDPEHIKQAYLKLKEILSNVKLFNNMAVASIVSDDDATVGMAWNGDAYKANQENPHVEYIYPAEGFVIWVDNLSIPLNAPHIDNAYLFINFLMRPDMAKYVTLDEKYASANLAARKLMPPALDKNLFIYPDSQTLKRGEFQTDLTPQSLQLYEKYWTLLKVES